MKQRILSLNQVIEITNLSRSTIYRLEALKEFPTRIQISPRRIGWLENQVIEWITKGGLNA